MKERALGLLGKKIGMTQIFNAEGHFVPVTVLEIGPCTVLAKRTKAPRENGKSDGYSALQLGFDARPEKAINKPEAGHLKKSGGKGKRFIKEMRIPAEELAKYEVGQDITLALFEGVQFIDIVGNTKGKGFAGVMKRHGFHGFRATHGTHEYRRHCGSIGVRRPVHTQKGRRMGGQMGTNQITLPNLKVVELDQEHNLLLVHGSVPGAVNSYLSIHPAMKKKAPKV